MRGGPVSAKKEVSRCQDCAPEQAQVCDRDSPGPAVGLSFPLKTEDEATRSGVSLPRPGSRSPHVLGI